MRVALAEGEQLVAALDTLVDGVHFSSGSDPADIGYKAVAVNLSDLAAMGARPLGLSAALLLPSSPAPDAAALRRGMAEAGRAYGLAAPGSRVAPGPFTVSVAALGAVPRAAALTRAGARAGDRVYVTGELGDAGLALREHYGRVTLDASARRRAWPRLRRPSPRMAAGIALRGIASAAIDVSDGLIADLGHLCRASGVCAQVRLGLLPLSDAVRGSTSREEGWRLAATGGDDYELCFTVPPQRVALLEAQAGRFACRISEIGRIETGAGVECTRPDGRPWHPGTRGGYRHFVPRSRAEGEASRPET